MNVDLCQCPCCGRMHRPLGVPPWALDHAQLCRLSRAFNEVARLDEFNDYHINEWLKRLIADSTPTIPARG